MMTRRTFMSAAAAAAMAVNMPERKASPPAMRWIINGSYLSHLPPDVMPAFDGTGSFVLCKPTDPPPVTGISITPVGNYKSFAQAQADAIDPGFGWLMYDPETWDLTPENERTDPRTAMRRFCQWAHRKGYQVMTSPARDLGNSDTVQRKLAGESLDSWYTRTKIAADGACWADAISIQSQADTTSLDAFGTFVTRANAAARSNAGNPYGLRLAGLSTRYGTAQQMAAAAHSVTGLVGGFWLNIPDSDFTKAAAFLRLVMAAA
jgi:hypothetical protein